MRGWLGRMYDSIHRDGWFPIDTQKAKELLHAKAVQLSVLKRFAEETQDPELLEHVRRREISLERLKDEVWLITKDHEGDEDGG